MTAGMKDGASVILAEQQRESARLVDRLKESVMAEMRDKDSLMLAVRGRWTASWDILLDKATTSSVW